MRTRVRKVSLYKILVFFVVQHLYAKFLLKRYLYQVFLLNTKQTHPVYVREGVPSKELKFEFSATMECLITEINLHKKKWAMLSIYRPSSQDEKRFYEELGKAMDYLSDTYENFIILGDFNNEENDHEIRNFLDSYGLNNLVKGATCFKSDTNPRTIDLILTNRKRCFSNTLTIETGLSDFHLKAVCHAFDWVIMTIQRIGNLNG